MENSVYNQVVLVTGATGRLGRGLVKALAQEGNSVRALMINKNEVTSLASGTLPIVGTLDNKSVLDEACKGVDVVFHLAAVVGESAAKAEELVKVNVEGTKNLLDACRRNKVKHVIFTSTVDVYGKKRSDVLNEESATMPTDKYGYSKTLAEQEIIKSGVPYTILRIANIYGPGHERSFFKVFRAVREGKMVIVGDGKNHVALIHMRDVIKALILVKDNPDISREKIYNLSDGQTYTQEYLVGLAAEMLKVEKPKRHLQEFVVRMLARQRNLDSDELRFLTSNRVLDISKIKKELGFEPEVDIKQGGREMIDEFLNRVKAK